MEGNIQDLLSQILAISVEQRLEAEVQS